MSIIPYSVTQWESVGYEENSNWISCLINVYFWKLASFKQPCVYKTLRKETNDRVVQQTNEKNNKTNRSLWKRTRKISVENINETRIPLQAIFPQIILDRISLTRHIFENNSPFQRISYVCRFYCWWNRKVSLVYQRTYHQLLQPFLGNLSAVCHTAFFFFLTDRGRWSIVRINEIKFLVVYLSTTKVFTIKRAKLIFTQRDLNSSWFAIKIIRKIFFSLKTEKT